jgi:diadenosine tetraphosphate (Ap4A) HIT family hydrolase
MNTGGSCPLCPEDPTAIWQNDELRVIDARHPDYPGYTRVIWNAHVTEMTDLDVPERQRLMRAVWIVEHTLRATLAPAKINLAEFGNQVPHLHWHIIPRWRDDPGFPEAIWAPTAGDPARLWAWTATKAELLARIPAYHDALRGALMKL